MNIREICKDQEDAKELHSDWLRVLERHSTQAKIGTIIREADQLKDAVALSPLDTDEEIAVVRKQRERLQGLERAITILTEKEISDGDFQRPV